MAWFGIIVSVITIMSSIIKYAFLILGILCFIKYLRGK